MSDSSTSDHALDAPDRWASVHTLLAECVKEPSEAFAEEVSDGSLAAEMSAHADALDLSLTDPEPPDSVDWQRLQQGYLDLFEARKQPFAPLAESPYKPWYEDHEGGLLEGPSAREMERRYEAIEASTPPEYPADHVALLLEYGALLLESGSINEYRAFLESHFDWIEALARQVDAAAAESPFHEWAVGVLSEVIATLRTRLDVSEPTEEEIESMTDRVQGS